MNPLSLITVILLALATLTRADIRTTHIHASTSPTFPIDEFGFTHTGQLDLNLTKITLSNPTPNLDLTKLGFFLCTNDAWNHVIQQLGNSQISCVLQSQFLTKILSFDQITPPNSPNFNTHFSVSNADHFSLVFANCLDNAAITMDVRSAMYNLNGRDGNREYLSAGRTVLPFVYFVLSLVHFGLSGFWVFVLYKKRLTVYKIHLFMLVVVVLKGLNLLCEAEYQGYVKRSGTAHGWDVLFYIFSFLKGIMLFTLIVLIGAGWSFLKPCLQGKEKKVLMVVIPLQVVVNIAQVVVDQSGPYGADWVTWMQILLLVDVVCCCAVLFPIVWSIKNLREAARTDGKAARSDGKAAVILTKLTLFRQYYVCYFCFTRVGVHALETTIASYKYSWTSVVAGELATLAFYVFTGYKFKPEAHNPDLVIDDDEEEAAAEQLKLGDECEL